MYGILLMAYFLGSIPTALWVGKLFFDVDIRELGSQNPGATNTLRVLGGYAAVVVLLVDVGKGALAAYLPIYFGVDLEPMYAGLAAVVGHCFSALARFSGGKAIATTAGMLLVADPVLLVIAYVCFFAVIFMTKYVFVGSISVGVAMFVYSFFDGKNSDDGAGEQTELIFFVYILFLVYLHRSNIRNFILGIEPKVNDKKLKNDRIKRPPRK